MAGAMVGGQYWIIRVAVTTPATPSASTAAARGPRKYQSPHGSEVPSPSQHVYCDRPQSGAKAVRAIT